MSDRIKLDEADALRFQNLQLRMQLLETEKELWWLIVQRKYGVQGACRYDASTGEIVQQESSTL